MAVTGYDYIVVGAGSAGEHADRTHGQFGAQVLDEVEPVAADERIQTRDAERADLAVHYAFGPAYGVPKAGTDKMAADMAYDFRDVGIAAVSIWMGSLLTDRVRGIIASNPEKFGRILDTAETPELTGHVIWALHQDPEVMALSGQTLIGAELALKYGIRDEGDRQPPSYREMFDVHPPAQCAHVMR